MSRFDTLGFSDLGTGDGVSREFPISGQDEAVTDFAVESVRRDGWQGQVLMSPNPRTNYSSYSNDFTRPEWNGSPSLLLGFKDQRYFVVDSSGALQQKPFSDIITFTRASGGGRFNAQGQYEWLPANTPRIDYDPVTGECLGLLIEEQRTNLLTYSSDFANAAWNKSRSTISADALTAPDGTVSADKIVEDTSASNTHLCSRTLAITSGNTYTLSVFAKIGERTSIALGMAASGFGVDQRVAFNLLSGAITTQAGAPAAKIEYQADGWVRCSITASATASVTTQVFIYLINAAGLVAYTGDGTSGIYIWGAQLEAGSFPISYIPTADAQVTRAADIASVNELSPWYNPEQGTLVARWSLIYPQAGTTHQHVAVLSDGGFNNYAGIRKQSTGVIRGQSIVGGSVQADIAAGTATSSVMCAAMRIKADNFAISLNGAAPGIDLSGTIPMVNRLDVGRMGGAGQYLNGHIESLRYYHRALSSEELQAITA